MNSSFSALHCYISDQMASLKYTGSQLQSLVKMVQHISVFILGTYIRTYVYMSHHLTLDLPHPLMSPEECMRHHSFKIGYRS